MNDTFSSEPNILNEIFSSFKSQFSKKMCVGCIYSDTLRRAESREPPSEVNKENFMILILLYPDKYAGSFKIFSPDLIISPAFSSEVIFCPGWKKRYDWHLSAVVRRSVKKIQTHRSVGHND